MSNQKFTVKIHKHTRNGQNAASIFHNNAKSNTYLFIALRGQKQPAMLMKNNYPLGLIFWSND